MATVLLAGAGGLLGRQLIHQLADRNHRVVALLHSHPLPPDLERRCAEVRRGDALKGSGLAAAVEGIDVVVSALGASVAPDLKGRRPYTRLDTPANQNLLHAARAAGVSRFGYVAVAAHDVLGHLAYVRAHERVVEALRASGLAFTVVRPTGFFGAFAAMLPIARRGKLPVFGDGSALTNPVHEADLAEYIADSLDGDSRELSVGGPEILTRREIAELAFAAVNRPPRIARAPVGMLKLSAAALRPLHPRMSQLLAFMAAISETDVLAPHYGTQLLADYLAEAAVGDG